MFKKMGLLIIGLLIARCSFAADTRPAASGVMRHTKHTSHRSSEYGCSFETVKLNKAIESQEPDVMEDCLHKGANPYQVIHGDTLLMKTVMSGNRDCLKVLLKFHQDIQYCRQRYDVFKYVTRNEDDETVNIVADSFNVGNIPASKKSHIWKLAIIDDRASCVESFLNRGFMTVQSRDGEGCTPLMIAAKAGTQAMGEFLQSRGADVNDCTEDGMTALMFATLERKSDFVTFLLHAGANVSAQTGDCETARSLAEETGAINQEEAKKYRKKLRQLRNRSCDIQKKLNSLRKNKRNATSIEQLQLEKNEVVGEIGECYERRMHYKGEFEGYRNLATLLYNWGDVGVKDSMQDQCAALLPQVTAAVEQLEQCEDSTAEAAVARHAIIADVRAFIVRVQNQDGTSAELLKGLIDARNKMIQQVKTVAETELVCKVCYMNEEPLIDQYCTALCTTCIQKIKETDTMCPFCRSETL